LSRFTWYINIKMKLFTFVTISILHITFVLCNPSREYLTYSVGGLPKLNDKVYCWKEGTYVTISGDTCSSYKSGIGKTSVGLTNRLNEKEFVTALEPATYFGTCNKTIVEFKYINIAKGCAVAIELSELDFNVSKELFDEISALYSSHSGKFVSSFSEGDNDLAYQYAYSGRPSVSDKVYCWESGTYISITGGVCGTVRSGRGKLSYSVSVVYNPTTFLDSLNLPKYYDTCTKPMRRSRYVKIYGSCAIGLDVEGLNNETANALLQKAWKFAGVTPGQKSGATRHAIEHALLSITIMLSIYLQSW